MPEDRIVYLTEQEEARARLKASVDHLADQLNLQVQMQKEPVKMLGGASAVGALIGVVAGRQLRRTKKVYVDAGSPVKHQKALVKAQQKSSGQSVGGALAATLGTLAFKAVMDKVVTPKLESIANNLLDKADQKAAPTSRPAAPRPGLRESNNAAAAPSVVAPSLSGVSTAPTTSPSQPQPVHQGVVPMPESKVEAKAVGTPIDEQDRVNPNLR